MLRRFTELMGRHWQTVLSFSLGLCLCFGLAVVSTPTTAQSITSGRVTEILDSDQVYIQEAIARVNDTASQGQQVRTGSARAQVNFNTGAVARLASNSVLTIGQCANLQRGTLLVNGSINGCTPSTLAGVRGTTYLLSVDEAGQETIQVLEGEVTLSKQVAVDTAPDTAPLETSDGTSDVNQDSITLMAGEKVQTTEGEDFGTVERMTANDFIEILLGELFDAFSGELPGMDQIRESFTQLFPGVPYPSGISPIESIAPPRPSLPF
ncbi:MAG TPA: FecR domain-containing protein [Candidatus Obscuribacterales bacterium]